MIYIVTNIVPISRVQGATPPGSCILSIVTKISVTNIITLTLTMQYIVINIIIVTIKSLDIVTNIVPISCVQARAAQLRREAWRETWPQLQLLHSYTATAAAW